MADRGAERCGVCGKREAARRLTGLRWAGRPEAGDTTRVCPECRRAISPLGEATPVRPGRQTRRLRRLIPTGGRA